MEQICPGPEDEAAHFAWALPAFRDPRHLHVDGKPIFVIFAVINRSDLDSAPVTRFA